jgi:hypothetical protein
MDEMLPPPAAAARHARGDPGSCMSRVGPIATSVGLIEAGIVIALMSPSGSRGGKRRR